MDPLLFVEKKAITCEQWENSKEEINKLDNLPTSARIFVWIVSIFYFRSQFIEAERVEGTQVGRFQKDKAAMILYDCIAGNLEQN